ncbi:hypothetical protein FB451DRAFT_1179073 [Mycena latifolia]|nr:hypothetical protein FB451DRAFT_1179073 [Mycena latifolia]
MKFDVLASLAVMCFTTVVSAAPSIGHITVDISVPTSLIEGSNVCPTTCQTMADCVPCDSKTISLLRVNSAHIASGSMVWEVIWSQSISSRVQIFTENHNKIAAVNDSENPENYEKKLVCGPSENQENHKKIYY